MCLASVCGVTPSACNFGRQKRNHFLHLTSSFVSHWLAEKNISESSTIIPKCSQLQRIHNLEYTAYSSIHAHYFSWGAEARVVIMYWCFLLRPAHTNPPTLAPCPLFQPRIFIGDAPPERGARVNPAFSHGFVWRTWRRWEELTLLTNV